MSTSIFGSVVLRTEDPRFIRGRGRYTDNVDAEGALDASFVRSMIAHARVVNVDVSASGHMPGVAAVLAAADLDLAPQPPSGSVSGPFERQVLARDRVRFVGEAIAVVLAESPGQAQDAAESVQVEYEPLSAVVGSEAALADGAPLLFPEAGSNLADGFDTEWEADVLAGADVVVRARFENHRVAPVPMETNAILVVPEDDGRLTVWVSTQAPFDIRNDLAEWLGLSKDRVRVIAPDVGGGFGAKLAVYPEYLVCAAAAVRLGRPVRWKETRSESMVNMTHGRGQAHDVELGARRDGTIVGLRVDILADMGAYPTATYLPPTTQMMLSGAYRIPRIACRVRSVVTNATPVGPYRGAGRPEATALLERSMDLLASELGLDPAEVRRRNLIPPDAFPHATAVGTTYDVGDYGRALDGALRLSGYERLREEQAARRGRGDRIQLGIGLSTYVEITGFAREFGSVEVHLDGSATVLTGISPHGQGHETSLAQITSGVLGIPMDRVRVVHSDTEKVPSGEGTYGSRSLQIGGSAVWNASQAVMDKGARLAAHLLEVGKEDIVQHEDGRIGVAGAPDRALTWSELATAATDPHRLPDGLDPGLSASGRFKQRGSTFPFGAHVAVVEVDLETGGVRPVRHVAVDDCGRILNPMLVEGQIHGGLAQGIAQALYESVEFDELGTPLTSNLASYLMPSAAELPGFACSQTETPTPLNPLGAKGIGEAATVGSAPAVQNAVVDALSHLGVRHIDMPCSPERVWRAIRGASGRAG
ncbi:MAG TPA: xanthine dehydrogenase family protein molybdopterin-binding subunit [Actinomycetota bacterium]|nr:xanthine dehydrogenase family protein molybdopterin-binding subunit [Actinomycetota bacterium]